MHRLPSAAIATLVAALALVPTASASDGVATIEMTPCHTATHTNYCVRVIHVHALPWTLEVVWTFCDSTGCDDISSQSPLWPAGITDFQAGGGDDLVALCVYVYDEDGSTAASDCA